MYLTVFFVGGEGYDHREIYANLPLIYFNLLFYTQDNWLAVLFFLILWNFTKWSSVKCSTKTSPTGDLSPLDNFVIFSTKMNSRVINEQNLGGFRQVVLVTPKISFLSLIPYPCPGGTRYCQFYGSWVLSGMNMIKLNIYI